MSTNPHLPPHVWYIIAAATLATLNCPDEIPKVYEHALGITQTQTFSPLGHDEQLNISRRLRESLIKTSAVGGVPKV